LVWFASSEVKAGLVYVGAETNNLYLCHFDDISGALELNSSITAQNPSCILIEKVVKHNRID
jgi:hypothetical protein